MEVIHFIKYKDRPNNRAVGEKSTHEDQTFFSVHARLPPWLPFLGAGGQINNIMRLTICQILIIV